MSGIDVRFLNRDEVASLLSMRQAIESVAQAFAGLACGEADIPPVINIQIPKAGEVDIKSGYLGTIKLIVVKVAAGFWQNPDRLGLPSVIGTILLVDATSGVPLAIMDGSYITAVRTGAAGAVAAQYLARADAQRVGMIGAGKQARMQLTGLLQVRPIQSVRVFDPINPALARRYADEMPLEFPGVKVVMVESAEQAVRDADIVVTATPSETALVHAAWIRPGTHINAIGADTPGKQELDPALFKAARVVVDRLSQCREMGESQHALKAGIISENDIYAELGEIVAGHKPGRQRDDEITLFDATGVAVQDIATAGLVYRAARAQGIGAILQWM